MIFRHLSDLAFCLVLAALWHYEWPVIVAGVFLYLLGRIDAVYEQATKKKPECGSV
jgi:hypothetical protein